VYLRGEKRGVVEWLDGKCLGRAKEGRRSMVYMAGRE
jgi:hypothetical protein